MNARRSSAPGPLAHAVALAVTGALATGTLASAPDTDRPGADTLLERHVEATGGSEAHLRLKNRKSTGRLKIDIAGHKFDAKVEKHTQAPGSSHTVIDGSQLFQVNANNEENAWQWRGDHSHGSEGVSHQTGEPHLLEGEEKTRALETARLHHRVHWRDHVKSAETVGIADVGGRPAYEVKIETKGGAKRTDFFDKENGRLVKTVQTIRHPSMGTLKIETYLEGYREFDGVWLATKERQILHSKKFGEGSQIWTYSDFEHNVEMPPSLFEMPEDLTS